MDYKEKYEQALKTAKILRDNSDDEICKKKIEAIFPELIESEDEKIRHELIDSFKKKNLLCSERFISWLEKQGGPIKLSEEERNRFAKGVLSECAISFINYLDSNKREGKMCVSNGECEDIENAFHNGIWDRLHRYYCKYIDKQDEQKPNFCHHEVDFSNCSEEYRKAYYDGWNNCNQQHEQMKNLQKPTWSEEDIMAIDCAVDFLNKNGLGSLAAALERVKSLADRTAWKPTEEQLNSLLRVAADTIGFNARILSELYDDLKQL